jgi:hypothetical protein
MICLWNTDGPPWKCQQCGWVYARKGEPILSDKPPRRNCPKARSRGLGDTIAKATRRLGIKPCGGCKKRQEKLNDLFPYRRKKHETPTDPLA